MSGFSRSTRCENAGQTASRKWTRRCSLDTCFAALIRTIASDFEDAGRDADCGIQDGPTAVDESEIQAIQTIAAAGVPQQPWPFLTAGDRVRIESGPLAGLEGILTEVRRSHRLVLSVTLLQRSVAVEIDSALVTAISSPESRGQKRRIRKNNIVPVSA